ncbi:MAG: BMP family ABC transporter substrate-binding protein [Gammaproteobacteria bacterium]|nr:BMP family ABC transporter substrate-binding protein [Gammaproteobacteria bacterium]
MKKIALALSLLICAFGVFALTGCGKKAELAVVTDVGQLMDGGFNQGTYEGVQNYAKANNKSYAYYQPENGADATDNDRIAAMELAVENGAKVIVAPGFLQATAMETVAKAHTDVKFVFVDGWALGLDNVTAISYKEQESGFLAGYAAVMDGYTKLGGVFGGGGSNPACNRFCLGYLQGADAAAKVKNVNVTANISFKYGSSFSASTELQTQASAWYAAGTEVIFSCGGSMVSSVVAAAKETTKGMIIGVDTDQSGLSDRVLTSAVKGLAASVELVLSQYYANEWDSKLANKTSNLGAKENSTGLPTASGSWRFKTFTVEQYNTLFAAIQAGTVVISADTPADCSAEGAWTAIDTALTNLTINHEAGK